MPSNPLRFAALAIGAALVLTACSGLPTRSDDTESDDSSLVALQLSGPAARYLTIAQPANIRLDAAFDGLEDDDDDLAAARANFALAAATERAFDRDLLSIALSPAAEATARQLVKVNEARADITEQAASSQTLDEVESYEQDIDLANDVVEVQVAIIRQQLHLPPVDAD